MYVCVPSARSAFRGQKRVLGILDLELQAVWATIVCAENRTWVLYKNSKRS